MHVRSYVRSETTAGELRALLGRVLGGPFPLGLRAWDGSQVGAEDGPVVEVRSRQALRRLLWSPDALGTGRAYVAGDLEVDGDLYRALEVFLTVADVPGGHPASGLRRRLGLLRNARRAAPGRGRGRDQSPLRRRERLPQAPARRVDGLLPRLLGR